MGALPDQVLQRTDLRPTAKHHDVGMLLSFVRYELIDDESEKSFLLTHRRGMGGKQIGEHDQDS